MLKILNRIPREGITEDAFGEIYQYFLGNFAQKEGQKGGEFFTPTSLVKLIVEVMEPDYGMILDPACGAGGMFVQSAVRIRNKLNQDPNKVISVYGQEKVDGTVKLCQMNLAVHGVSGLRNIRQGNTYYEDIHKSATYDKDARDSIGVFDFVMANPPFNVNGENYLNEAIAFIVVRSRCGVILEPITDFSPTVEKSSGAIALKKSTCK